MPPTFVELAAFGRRREDRAAEDLRWYFAEGLAVGAPASHFGVMLEALRARAADRAVGDSWQTVRPASHFTRSHLSTELDGRLLEDAARAARLRRILGALPETVQAVLALAFGSRPGPELSGLGDLTPLAVVTPAALDAHRDSGTDRTLEEWLVRLSGRCAGRGSPASGKKRKQERSTPADRVALEAIRAEAEALRSAALAAFRRASDAWAAVEFERARARTAARARVVASGRAFDAPQPSTRSTIERK